MVNTVIEASRDNTIRNSLSTLLQGGIRILNRNALTNNGVRIKQREIPRELHLRDHVAVPPVRVVIDYENRALKNRLGVGGGPAFYYYHNFVCLKNFIQVRQSMILFIIPFIIIFYYSYSYYYLLFLSLSLISN